MITNSPQNQVADILDINICAFGNDYLRKDSIKGFIFQ